MSPGLFLTISAICDNAWGFDAKVSIICCIICGFIGGIPPVPPNAANGFTRGGATPDALGTAAGLAGTARSSKTFIAGRPSCFAAALLITSIGSAPATLLKPNASIAATPPFCRPSRWLNVLLFIFTERYLSSPGCASTLPTNVSSVCTEVTKSSMLAVDSFSSPRALRMAACISALVAGFGSPSPSEGSFVASMGSCCCTIIASRAVSAPTRSAFCCMST
mmetsp:Transcript_1319/g.5399  ORF Transcript_1319/g.5399 Transcript_1319/m.5399 type:complete len:221 (+) Transcript_1319:302-964(+)